MIGKSQALNTWLKEFMFNILIQPFHCIIYMAFAYTAIDILKDNWSLSAPILAVIMLVFIFQAEGIIKKIFGFEQSKSLGSGLASAAIIGSSIGNLSKAVGTAKGVGSAVKSGSSSSKGGSGKSVPNMKNNTGDGKSTSEKEGKNTSKNGKGSGAETKDTSTNSSTDKNGNKENERIFTDEARKNGENIDAPEKSEKTERTGFRKALDTVGTGAKNVANTIGSGAKKLANTKGGKFAGAVGRTAGRRIKNGAKSLPGKYIRGSVKAGFAIAGAALAGAQGDLTSMYAAGSGMRKLGKATVAKADDVRLNNKVKNNERTFAENYEKYADYMREKNPSITDEQIARRSKALLEADPSKIKEPEEKEFAESLYDLRDTYDAIGEEDSNARVIDTVNAVQNGELDMGFVHDVREERENSKDRYDQWEESYKKFKKGDITLDEFDKVENSQGRHELRREEYQKSLDGTISDKKYRKRREKIDDAQRIVDSIRKRNNNDNKA